MDKQLNPLALSAENLVTLLQKAGYRAMTLDLLQEDIDGGVPVNADGTINLIKYMAWLIREVNACREEGLKTVAFTFSMHPCRLFSNREIQLIYTEEEKTTLFSETGVDALVYFPFDDVTAQMAPVPAPD